MIKKRWILLLLAAYLLFGAAFTSRLLTVMEPPEIDMVAINRIGKETMNQWDLGSFSKADNCPYDYTVLDSQGVPLFQSAPSAPVTISEAMKNRDTVLDVMDGHTVRGHILIAAGYNRALLEAKSHLALWAVLLLLLPAVPVLFCALYLNHAVLRPFRRMKAFARHIALGDLDFPLPMDKNHVFGAFTESFDIMRDQLREARAKEAAASQSKKELVASLSHDIKTPVASIKLTSELLLVTETDEKVKDKLQTIYQKSDQIDRLITNMLQASLEDLGHLTVTPAEVASLTLEEIIRDADYRLKAEPFSLPGCLLLVDPFRMEQIIGNIFNNAYKYADTAITITSEITEDGLRLEFMDYGKGVPEEELPLLTGKFYRGTNSEQKADGSGLGLYISRNLMERMNGIIECRNRDDGFSVILYLPLKLPGV